MQNRQDEQNRGLVVLFLSCGRSGTQWLAKNLARIYGDIAEVEHEAVGGVYRSNQFFRRPETYAQNPDYPKLVKHLDWVAEVTGERPYIETGWPGYAAIPLFRDRFGERFRLVHLVRNPILVASSLVTHEFYDPDSTKGLLRVGQLFPTDAGVRDAKYEARWEQLTRFEKCLFHWREINTYGLELESTLPEARFKRVRAEDLFAGDRDVTVNLLRFMGLPLREDFLGVHRRKVDKYSYITSEKLEVKLIGEHPSVLALAKRFGYEKDDVDERAIEQHYNFNIRWALKRYVLRPIMRLLNTPKRWRRKYLSRLFRSLDGSE